MKKHNSLMAAYLVVLLATAGQLVVASDETTDMLSNYFPANALVYFESTEFASNLDMILKSDLARRFGKSRVYTDFSKSKLFNKLSDRISEMEEGTGFGWSLDRLQQISGNSAGLALYDIGELKFLFISKISMEKVVASYLWNLRDSFESRQTNDRETYFVKEDPAGRVSLAFAVVGDYLLVGSDVKRFEDSLALLKSEGPSLASDPEYVAAFPENFKPGSTMLYLNQKDIANTPYFDSYWIFGNQGALEDVISVGISLHFDDVMIKETRFVLKENNPLEPKGYLGGLAGLMPENADYYEYGAIESGSLQSVLGWYSGDYSTELLKVVSAAEPITYALSSTLSTEKSELSSSTDKMLVLHLATPDQLDQQALEKAISSFYQKKLAHEGTVDFSFVDDGNVRVLNIPLLEDYAPAYKQERSVLIFANCKKALSAKSQGNEEQRAFTNAIPKMTRGFVFKAEKFGESATDSMSILGANRNWDSDYNARFFKENVPSFLDMTGFIREVHYASFPSGMFTVETINYLLD